MSAYPSVIASWLNLAKPYLKYNFYKNRFVLKIRTYIFIITMLLPLPLYDTGESRAN